MRPLSLQGHTRPLTRVRINQEGDLLFTASKDHFPAVWFLENGERIGTFDGHTGVIWDIDISWDTRHLVSSSGDPSVRVWDVQTGQELSMLQVPTVGRSVSMSYSGNLLAYTTTKVALTPPKLFIADIRDAAHVSGDSTIEISLDSVGANCCTFTHMDDTVVIGTTNGILQQFDLRNPSDVVNFSPVHNNTINDLQCSRDEGLLVSSSNDRTAKLHDAKDLTHLKTFKRGRPVNSAAISPTHPYVVVGGGEEAMTVTQTAASAGQFETKLFHAVYETEFAHFKGHFGPVNTVAFSPDGKTIVTGSEDGFVRVQEMDKEYFDYDADY
ncbi:unnamed protein product [Bursaphelenchus okinawaensis]|uniref:Eukaryotic translation initiation factor 3 subunit I n=1 Tax=Bursaphelenchus okinawaensis TaxID=465554 RepID=A0A811JVF1_9BILA|nr:unnamed protein product [Bursaphelenchus okinawaensis]CAG9085784.1 unnamed protein product [Bursaphelenchus okinawaensis]